MSNPKKKMDFGCTDFTNIKFQRATIFIMLEKKVARASEILQRL